MRSTPSKPWGSASREVAVTDPTANQLDITNYVEFIFYTNINGQNTRYMLSVVSLHVLLQ